MNFMGTVKEKEPQVRKKGFGAFRSKESVLIFLFNVLYVLQKGMVYLWSVLFILFVLVTQGEFQTQLGQGTIHFGDTMTTTQNQAIGTTILALAPLPLFFSVLVIVMLLGFGKLKNSIATVLVMGIFIPYLLFGSFFAVMVREDWVSNYAETLYALFFIALSLKVVRVIYEKYILNQIKCALGSHGRVYGCDLQQLTNQKEAVFEVAAPWKEHVVDEGNATFECQPGVFAGRMNDAYLINDSVVWSQQRRVRYSFLRFSMQPNIWLLTKEGLQEKREESMRLNKKITYLSDDTLFIEEANIPWREKVHQLFHVKPENKEERMLKNGQSRSSR
ncbi:hypothetical protein HCA69_15515 [Listeria grandensis]|uniref:Uncharacterized protein n=1 Tax=Listeria grandensis TaxID=1494963 RepID=A0A7X1CR75_9LIST|nr:hypothetical protein [Listeria grandensis]MBC1937777.1 hypothetical protein [Listeria grandensis]